MKRFGNLWPDVIDTECGIQSIIDGTRFKRGQRDVQWLLYSDEAVANNTNLWHRIDENKARIYSEILTKNLKDGTWKHQPPRHKAMYCRNRASSHGKWRDLYIPQLDDHIVAHMVMRASMKAFTRGMHPHCCGSVPGRGIKHVNKTVKNWLTHDRQCRYFVKLDIRHFFDTIDREILLSVLESKIKDKNVIRVFEQIIDSAPIPCPVGYYTSPWLANLYLEKLDWFVEQQLYKERRGKRIKYVRHYLRYVDDILLIGTSKADLKKAIRAIRRFLNKERKVDIKNAWEIKPIGKHNIVDGEWRMKAGTYWCDIGGYKFCKDATILRDGIFLSARRLARQMRRAQYYTVHQSYSINSRVGWATHCNSRNFVRREIEPYVNIETARRVISNVGKIGKWRSGDSGGPGTIRQPYYRAPCVPACA